MNELLLAAGLIALIAIALAFAAVVFVRSRRRRLSAASRRAVRTAWNHARALPDPVRRVMEADKVLDLALRDLGYTGSLGEKLKRAGPRFSDVNAVWRAHKLRNTLAHEAGAHVSNAEASSALRAFERALRDLGL